MVRRVYTVTGLINGDVIKYWLPISQQAAGHRYADSTYTQVVQLRAVQHQVSPHHVPAPLPAAQLVVLLVDGDWFGRMNSMAPDSLIQRKWNYHVGNGYNSGIAAFDGWGNQELEWYRPEIATSKAAIGDSRCKYAYHNQW